MNIYAVLVRGICKDSHTEVWKSLKFIPAKSWAQAIGIARTELDSDQLKDDLRFDKLQALSADNLQAMIQTITEKETAQ